MMEAGVDLDIVVAEQVMGWKRGRVYSDNHWHWEGTGWSQGYFTSSYKPFNPSVSISTAWEVVEKLDLIININRVDNKKYVVSFSDEQGYYYADSPKVGENYIVPAVSDTAPHAICLAALKAVGYKDE